MTEGVDPLGVEFVTRFQKVSTDYPHRVAQAYGGDDARALGDDPETVARTVAEWERSQGLEPTDWGAVGRGEGQAGVDEGPGGVDEG